LVSVISRSRRLWLITLTSTLIILTITKTSSNNCLLLYLPTQIGFLIGGKCVTCHGSKPTNSLGRTKLTNSLGKQQHELSTHMWSFFHCSIFWKKYKICSLCYCQDLKPLVKVCENLNKLWKHWLVDSCSHRICHSHKLPLVFVFNN